MDRERAILYINCIEIQSDLLILFNVGTDRVKYWKDQNMVKVENITNSSL